MTETKADISIRFNRVKNQLINLEFMYQRWFDQNKSFIEEYFNKFDIRKGLEENSGLSDMIKSECLQILSANGF